MAKLSPNPISEADFQEYINSQSDFGFELSVLQMLRSEAIECQHGGLYDDPVTGKSREFDIRANTAIGEYRVKLAIECKNIRSNYPLLVSCTPRHKSESYHFVVKLAEPEYQEHERMLRLEKSRAMPISVSNNHSIYPPEEPVGKSIAQVGRAAHNDEIVSSDGDVFDKWSQCLSSLVDLVQSLYWEHPDEECGLALATAIPILVVPNGRLWTVQYDVEGQLTGKPRVVDRCPCYVGKEYEVGSGDVAGRFVVSHIDLVTVDGLKNYVRSVLGSEEGIKRLFNEDALFRFLVHQRMPK